MESLSTLPEGIEQTDALIDRVDTCFMLGFSRLGAEQTESLAALARTFTGTPLAERLKAAVEGISRAEFREEHFTALAAARCALQGAQYDALMDAGANALGLAREPLTRGEAPETPGPIGNWMTSTRQWLLELALAGFMQLDQQNVKPFIATLEQLQQSGDAPRLAMLLTGYVHELNDAIPASQLDVVPARRWVDLWCRAMVSAMGLPAPPAASEISGSLYLLGLDLRHHTNAVSAAFYGVVEGDGDVARFVRVTVSAYKVELVTGDEVFQAFDEERELLFTSWSKGKALDIKGMTLRDSGDLIWDGSKAKLGKSYDLFVMANQFFGSDAAPLRVADVSPEDRHPIQIALPVYTAGYKVAKSGERFEVDLGGASVGVDGARMSDVGSFGASDIQGTKECFGLLRFDAGNWSLQPLVATKGKVLMRAGDKASTSRNSSSTISVLKERAGKLLRKKS